MHDGQRGHRRILGPLLAALLAAAGGGCRAPGADGISPPRPVGVHGDGTVTCPVSGRTLEEERAVAYVHEGRTIFFCCLDCLERFKKDPLRWIEEPRR